VRGAFCEGRAAGHTPASASAKGTAGRAVVAALVDWLHAIPVTLRLVADSGFAEDANTLEVATVTW